MESTARHVISKAHGRFHPKSAQDPLHTHTLTHTHAGTHSLTGPLNVAAVADLTLTSCDLEFRLRVVGIDQFRPVLAAVGTITGRSDPKLAPLPLDYTFCTSGCCKYLSSLNECRTCSISLTLRCAVYTEVDCNLLLWPKGENLGTELV